MAAAAFAVLARAILSSTVARQDAIAVPAAAVASIGRDLMGKYVLPLEIVGLLLTAAMVGAAVIALREKRS